ncbi:ydjO [Escherichia coli]|nr:ydjO [Escherichia coli]
MMSLWDALRMNMMISYQELVRTFLKTHVNTLLSTQKNILFSFKSPFSAIKKHQTVILLARR